MFNTLSSIDVTFNSPRPRTLWRSHRDAYGRLVSRPNPPPSPEVEIPAARLVGIELNPGPPKKGQSKAKPKTIIVAAAAAPRPNRRRVRNRVPGGMATEVFRQSALNPFQYSPPILGYDSFSPMNLDSAWVRNIGLANPNATCGVFICDPSALGGVAAGALGAVNTTFCRVAYTSNPAISLDSLATTTTGFPATNLDALRSRHFVSRTTTAALRVTVRYAATSAPGRLFAFNTLDADTVLGTKSIVGLINLEQAHPIAFDASGVATIQVNWRQRSQSDFVLANGDLAVGGVAPNLVATKMVIIALGWPTGFSADVEAIAHIEGDPGDLPGAPAASDVNTLAQTTPLEQLGAMIRKIPDVLDRSALLACQSAALMGSIRRHRITALAASTIPHTVLENDYVNLRSTAGEFVTGASEEIRSHFPSAATMGATAAAVALERAVAYARNRHAGELLN